MGRLNGRAPTVGCETPTAHYFWKRAGPTALNWPPASGWPGHKFLAPVLFVALAAGCSQQFEPIFVPPVTEIFWPQRPAEAKVRYVGQIRSAADLKPAPKPFQVLGALFVGADEPPQLYGPRSVICTSQGERVWVADPGGRRVHMFDLQRRTYESITGPAGSPLLAPVDLCSGPEDSIYVCDSEGVAIHRLAESDGTWLESLQLPEEVRRPVALHFDPDNEELFVVDAAGHDIKVLGRDGRLRRILGQRGVAPGEFNFPCDILQRQDLIWVVDTGNHRVQSLTRLGKSVAVFGKAGDAPGDLALPKSIAFDSDGHLYVVDSRFENVQIFDRSGSLLLFFGEEGIGPGEFWLP
ncbi:MAG: NHL domain-containing protein, partial [Planctomycetota bacterium]